MGVEKYHARADAITSLVCIGLDSDFAKLPERFLKTENPQFEFNKYLIGETNEYAASYKLNSAFYEARGDQGIREMKMTMEYLQANHPDIFTIDDAKRADIGNTNNGYVSFIFDWLGFDAVTVNPYLGKEALEPFLARSDKVSIVLCRTSNPGSGEFQNIVQDGKPLWQTVAEKVCDEWNTNNNCMLVAGATYPEELGEIREAVGDMDLLIPGLGAQGGDVKATVEAGKNSEGKGMLIHSARAVIFSENPKRAAEQLRDEVNGYR